ncbi:MAG: hypothetical protein MUP41_13530, partial [Desulfobacterales bacterium]|nr:hypothetical protein [Desulfobacterales bacterium]
MVLVLDPDPSLEIDIKSDSDNNLLWDRLNILIGICFSACDMSNTRKASYQYERADVMVKNP